MGSVGGTSTRARYFTELIEERAAKNPDFAIYFVPKGSHPSEGYDKVTLRALAMAIDRAAWWFEESFGRTNCPATIGYIGPGDVRYSILMTGAAKAGYNLLLASPRNSLEGQLALIDACHCKLWIRSAQIPIDHIVSKRSLKVVDVPDQAFFLDAAAVEPYVVRKDWTAGRLDPFVTLHTSGSTGLPKPIVWSHEFMATCERWGTVERARPLEMDVYAGGKIYCGLPAFHVGSAMATAHHNTAAGVIVGFIRPLCDQFTLYLAPPGPPNLDMTLSMVESLDLDHLILAPSILEEIAAAPEHLQQLSKIKSITTGGGPVSRKAGDKIWEVTRLMPVLGTTEAGYLPSFLADPEDWNYWHFHPKLGIEFHPRSDNLHEMVICRDPTLEAEQAVFKVFPDIHEFRVGDLYSLHPTKPHLVRYEGRNDDIIVLSNGEKFVPIDMESALASHALVRSAVIVGQGRSQVAAIIELQEKRGNRTVEEILNELFEINVSQANKSAPAHAQLARELMMAASAEKPFLRAGKGTVQRRPTVSLYDAEVEALYAAGEAPGISTADMYDMSSMHSLKAAIRKSFEAITKLKISDEDDVFKAGMDSLQVQQMQRRIRSGTSQQRVDSRFIYRHPTIAKLSSAVFDLAHGKENDSMAISTADRRLALDRVLETHIRSLQTSSARKCGRLSDSNPSPRKPRQLVNVILTGSTGSLGAYILDTLLADQSVGTVWCINRSSNAGERQRSGASTRGLRCEAENRMVKYLHGDLSKEELGLSHEEYEDLERHATHIIPGHVCGESNVAMLEGPDNQWQVDFNLSLPSFAAHISGVERLVALCSSSANEIKFQFISSVGVGSNWPNTSQPIPETPITDLTMGGMGYGESKLISENVLLKASEMALADLQIVRVGQIAGPVEHDIQGQWNKQEWLPTIIETSLHLGCLPKDLGAMSSVDWFPVDILSAALVELCLSNDSSPKTPAIYHCVNPHSTNWERLLPVIQARLVASSKSTAKFSLVSFEEWVTKLRSASQNGVDDSGISGVKLLDFYASLVDGQPIRWDTRVTQQQSTHVRSMPGVTPAWVDLWMRQWGYLVDTR